MSANASKGGGGATRTPTAVGGGVNRPLKFSGEQSVVKKGNNTYFYNSTSAKPATSFNKKLSARGDRLTRGAGEKNNEIFNQRLL